MNLFRKFYALTDVELNVGSGGAKIKVDQISGSDYEVVKQAFGIEGVATMVNASNPLPTTDSAAEVSLASIDLKLTNPLPVSITSDIEIGKVKLLDSGGTNLGSISAAGALKVDNSAVTQPISAAALPLPSGAATSALQTQPGVDIGDVTVNNASGASAVNIQDGGNSITVDYATTGSGTATGALRVELPSNGTGIIATVGAVTAITNALPAGTNLLGKTSIDQTTPGTTNLVALTAETTKVIGTVNVSAAQTIATVTTVGTVTSVTQNADVRQATASNFNAQVVGNIAHDGVDSGNPVKVGLRAIAFGTNPTAVSAADRTDWYANRAGIAFVLGGHPNIVCFRATYTTAQTDTAIVSVAGGLKIVVTRLTVAASAANTVNPSVIIGFGAANTPTTTGVVLSHPGVAPGSGVVEGNGAGILGIGADGEDLRITSGVPTSGSIDVVCSYFTIES